MKTLQTVLRENVVALLEAQGGPLRPNETGVSRLVKLGIAQGNAQRVLEGATNVGLELLARLATVLRVTPWQLLVPQLDPKQLPGLTADETAWPFPMVDRSAYRALTPEERVFVQGALAQAIADRSRGKPAAAA